MVEEEILENDGGDDETEVPLSPGGCAGDWASQERDSSDDDTDEQKKCYDGSGNSSFSQTQAEIAGLVDSTNFCDFDAVVIFLVLRPRDIPIW